MNKILTFGLVCMLCIPSVVSAQTWNLPDSRKNARFTTDLHDIVRPALTIRGFDNTELPTHYNSFDHSKVYGVQQVLSRTNVICPAPNMTDIFYMWYFTTDTKEDITATRTSLELQKYTRDRLPKVITYGMDPAEKILKEHFRNQGVEIVVDSEICASLSSKIASIEGLRDVSGMYVLYLKIDDGYLALYRDNRYNIPPDVAVKLNTLFNVQKLIDNR